jgi:Protein of unknown function (DUF1800)
MPMSASQARLARWGGLTALAAAPVAGAAAVARRAQDGGETAPAVAPLQDDRSRMAHLFRRAGFGASPAELDAAVSRGYDATLENLLSPSDDHDAADDALSQIDFDLTKLDDAQRWWIVRMRYTSRPLIEKMTLFWHGHFATAVSKVGIKQLALMRQQNDLFRSQALGNFHDLLLSVSKDPAMLIWLDGRQNHKNAPNENYGRELMELFTMGIGNYSEDDVKAAAHSFTGWTINRDFAYTFNAGDHDAGSKTFLGKTGNFNGNDIIDTLSGQQATAIFLATKLVRYFVSDPPDSGLVSNLASVYLSSGYDMKAVMRALFKSDAFVSPTAYHALIKNPAEFVAGTLRTLDISTDGTGLPAVMRALNQELFNPPNVAGWPGGDTWIATNTMLARDNLANAVAVAQKPGSGYLANAPTLLGLSGTVQASSLVDGLTHLLVDSDLSNDSKQALYTYLGKGPSDAIDVTQQDGKVRGVLYLTLSSPEYSLN